MNRPLAVPGAGCLWRTGLREALRAQILSIAATTAREESSAPVPINISAQSVPDTEAKLPTDGLFRWIQREAVRKTQELSHF